MAAARRFEAEAVLPERFAAVLPERLDAALVDRLDAALLDRLDAALLRLDEPLPPDDRLPADRLLDERLLEPLDFFEPPLDLPLLRRCAI